MKFGVQFSIFYLWFWTPQWPHSFNAYTNLLFVDCLTVLSVTQTETVSNVWMTVNWKGCGKKWSCPNVRYYSGLFLGVWGKPRKVM
jgi:hypothetical protein